MDQLTVTAVDAGCDAQVPITATSHILDVSKTGRLRLADLDLEDIVSAARSDTRFTDDTTRSDPANNLQREDLMDYG